MSRSLHCLFTSFNLAKRPILWTHAAAVFVNTLFTDRQRNFFSFYQCYISSRLFFRIYLINCFDLYNFCSWLYKTYEIETLSLTGYISTCWQMLQMQWIAKNKFTWKCFVSPTGKRIAKMRLEIHFKINVICLYCWIHVYDVFVQLCGKTSRKAIYIVQFRPMAMQWISRLSVEIPRQYRHEAFGTR